MGFSHPFAFPIQVLSNDFCKASFACNTQFSSLDCFHTLRTYRPPRALQPTACDLQQPPVSLPDTHISGEKRASWEWGSWRGSHEEALGAACTGGCDKGHKPCPSVPRQGWRRMQLSRPEGVASLADHDISALYRLHFTTAQKKQKVGLEGTEKQHAIFYLYWKRNMRRLEGGSSLPNTVS